MTQTLIDRRTFLSTGISLAAGAVIPGHLYAAPAKETIIGCYSSIEEILEQPASIDNLQKKLDVNVLLVGSPVTMPESIRKLNPLTHASMFANHIDDDSTLRRAIEETHRRGMKFWLYFSGHHNSADERAVMSETFDGVLFADLPPIKYALSQNELTTCFEKKAVRTYVDALFGFAPKEYDVDGMYVSHTRYATPSFWTNLTGCACEECRAAMIRKGYDPDEMKSAINRTITGLKRLDARRIKHFSETGISPGDLLTIAGEDNGIMDWLYCRASIVGDALKRMHTSVHEGSNGRAKFVTDTHNITMSLLVGHNYEDLIGGGSDGFHPLSWCAYQHISVVAAWANQLCEWIDGLDESSALRIVMSLFGWDNLGLPTGRIADLRIGASSKEHLLYGDAATSFYGYFNPDLTLKLMKHEWTKAAAINGGRIPSHPVIKGEEWPEEVCRELMNFSMNIGNNVYIFQGTSNILKKS